MSSYQAPSEFKGLRILLVEDDLLLAMEMEEVLRDLGCEIVGPFARLNEAIAAAVNEALDGAIVDLNLRGEMSFPLIEELRRKSVPCVLCSGYADLPEMRSQLREIPKLGKPCNHEHLVAAMRTAFVARAQAAQAVAPDGSRGHP
jgi:DNA-binding response OmpR family regulator